jgi:integrase
VSVTKSLEEVKGQLRIKEPKREKSRRLIQVSPFTVEALRGHRAAMIEEKSHRADGPVFCGRRSRTWLRKSDIYRHSFEPLLRAAGLDFNFHILWHSCATFLLAAGAGVKEVQERLGHSTAVMTLNTYAHFVPGAQAGAAAKLNTILATADQSPAARKG